MRCGAEGGRKGRRRAERWVGPRSGLAPASAAAPEPVGVAWTPLRLLGPQDRSPRCSPITDQGREPPAEPHKWASRSEIHTQGRATWKCVLGAEISLAADLSKPCLSPGARRALSLSLSLCGRRRVWTRSQGGDVSHTWLPAPQAPWKPRCHADRCHAVHTGAFTHPPGQALKARQQDTWGLEVGRLHVICILFACALIPGLLPRPGPADAGSVLSLEPDLTA